MVRLKAFADDTQTGYTLLFQFQNGTIKSDSIAVGLATLARFNSKMVRLKATKLI